MSIVIPTCLTKEQVLTFQELYFERYQEKINFEQASQKGLQLVQFMATILKYRNAEFVKDDD